MYCQKAWWTRSVPISTIMKKSQGLVVSRWRARANRLSVIRTRASRIFPLSGVRKSLTSNS